MLCPSGGHEGYGPRPLGCPPFWVLCCGARRRRAGCNAKPACTCSCPCVPAFATVLSTAWHFCCKEDLITPTSAGHPRTRRRLRRQRWHPLTGSSSAPRGGTQKRAMCGQLTVRPGPAAGRGPRFNDGQLHQLRWWRVGHTAGRLAAATEAGAPAPHALRRCNAVSRLLRLHRRRSDLGLHQSVFLDRCQCCQNEDRVGRGAPAAGARFLELGGAVPGVPGILRALPDDAGKHGSCRGLPLRAPSAAGLPRARRRSKARDRAAQRSRCLQGSSATAVLSPSVDGRRLPQHAAAAPDAAGDDDCRSRGPHRQKYSEKELALAQRRWDAWANGSAVGVGMCLAVKGARRRGAGRGGGRGHRSNRRRSEAAALQTPAPPAAHPPARAARACTRRPACRPAGVGGVPPGPGGRPHLCLRHRQRAAAGHGAAPLPRGARPCVRARACVRARVPARLAAAAAGGRGARPSPHPLPAPPLPPPAGGRTDVSARGRPGGLGGAAAGRHGAPLQEPAPGAVDRVRRLPAGPRAQARLAGCARLARAGAVRRRPLWALQRARCCSIAVQQACALSAC